MYIYTNLCQVALHTSNHTNFKLRPYHNGIHKGGLAAEQPLPSFVEAAKGMVRIGVCMIFHITVETA